MRIREAKLSDIDSVINLINLLEKTEKSLNPKISGTATFSNEYKADIANEIVNDNNLILLVEYWEEIVWILAWEVWERHNFWVYEKFAHLDQLYIEKKFRNQGFAEKLCKYFFDWVKKKWCDIVVLSVLEQNKIARELYKKLGFKTHILKLEKQL